jgi:hypothetical protein
MEGACLLRNGILVRDRWMMTTFRHSQGFSVIIAKSHWLRRIFLFSSCTK